MNPYKYVCDLPVRKITTAQEAIEKSMSTLLDNKNLYELSVREICKTANVARSTFYAYYDGIDAIKNHLYQHIPERLGANNKELTLEIIASQAIGAYQYWLKNPYELDIDYVKKLIRKTIETYTE